MMMAGASVTTVPTLKLNKLMLQLVKKKLNFNLKPLTFSG
jgi:hypothetical protein